MSEHNLFERWRLELAERDLDPKTRERYWTVAVAFQRWLADHEPSPAEAKTFLAHLRSKGYAQRSVLLYYHALRLMLDYCGTPLRLKIRNPKTLPRYWSAEDVERLIRQAAGGLSHHGEAIRVRNVALVMVMAYAGLRREEVIHLRVQDVDFTQRLLFVRGGKGDKDRAIPLADRLVPALRGQCNGKSGRDRVFPLAERTVYNTVTKLARAAGLNGLHPHSLRHAFGTRLAERRAPIRAIQELMGHASIETTCVYLEITAGHLRDAVALLDSAVPPAAPMTAAIAG